MRVNDSSVAPQKTNTSHPHQRTSTNQVIHDEKNQSFHRDLLEVER